MPLSPKSADGVPVAASSATSFGPAVSRMRGGEPAVARPVGDAARGRPDTRRAACAATLLCRVGFEREHLIAARRQIHHAADHDRRDLRIAARRLRAFGGNRCAASLCRRRACRACGSARGRTFTASGCGTPPRRPAAGCVRRTDHACVSVLTLLPLMSVSGE